MWESGRWTRCLGRSVSCFDCYLLRLSCSILALLILRNEVTAHGYEDWVWLGLVERPGWHVGRSRIAVMRNMSFLLLLSHCSNANMINLLQLVHGLPKKHLPVVFEHPPLNSLRHHWTPHSLRYNCNFLSYSSGDILLGYFFSSCLHIYIPLIAVVFSLAT